MSKIDVILPVYNGIKYLKDNILSVLNQTFTDFDFIIVDDQSTDGSWEYLQTICDKRIQLVRNQSNMGLFYNLNYMIKNSNSPLVKLWAQDDLMGNTCLENIVKFHNKYPEIGFSYSDRQLIDENGELESYLFKQIDLTPEIVDTKLHTRIAFFVGSIAGNIANTTLVRNALNKVGLFNEEMKIAADFEMWVRLAKYFPIGHIKSEIVQLRNHTKQLSRNEEYFIYHIKEDLIVYRYLFSYITFQEIKKGKYYLRNFKLLFYYTLMIKALLKGKFKIFFQFFYTLKQFDNILILTFFFVKNRILFKRYYLSLYSNNEKFFAAH